jgi:hypothetical protein
VTWRLVVALGVAACAGAQRPSSQGSSGAPSAGVDGTARRPRAPVDPSAICDRIADLKAQQCSIASDYSLSRDECVEDWRRSLEDRGEDARLAATTAGQCITGEPTCSGVGACLDAIVGADAGFRDCADRSSSAPVGRPRDEWDRRRGATARRYSEVPTTAAEPIEVCTIRDEMTFLLGATCDDGSRPFADYDHAHAARVGNVGPGGACGSIIDLYEVPCPERTYQIHFDSYVCPLP